MATATFLFSDSVILYSPPVGEFLEEFREQIISRVQHVGPIANAVISQQLVQEEAAWDVQTAPTPQEALKRLFKALETAPPQSRESFLMILKLYEPKLMEELGESIPKFFLTFSLIQINNINILM